MAWQALEAGTYTIKARGSAHFLPFDVQIGAGTPTRLAKGGVVQFDWPGGDCWDIFRGAEALTYQCGTAKQALSAGRYTIKSRGAPLFSPFDVEIKDVSSTRVAKGGVFQFNWPGADCWDIFRGAQAVTYQCGTAKQALAAGRYTIKSRGAPLFKPFDVTIRDGATTTAP
jgi:hypothetical protein